MGESLSATELRSLRMDRRSPEAARLRDAVSKKLLDFLGNYSDDVLAEYIVVLVCNGKHQTQARDDLQAFLGEESGTFVDWLWNYLSKNFTAEATPDALDPEAKKVTKSSNSLDSEHKINVLTDHVSHSIGLSKTKNETFDRPSYRANSNHMEPIKVSVRQKSCPPDLDDCSADINNEILMVDDISLHKSSGSRSGNFIEPAKNSISIKSSQEVASVGKQALHCESQNRKIQKIRSSAVPSQLLPEPMAEQTAIILPSVIAEKQLSPSSSTNPVETKMLSTDVDDSLHQTARLRGNVWDRLGRPHAHTQKSIKEAQSHNLDFIDGGMLDNQEEPQNPILKRFPPVASSVSCLNKQAYAVDRGGLEGISAKISVEGRLDQANNINTLKRKIDADGYFRVKEPSQQQQQSLPIKQNRQQNMNMSAKVADKPVSSLIDKPVSSNAKFGLINPAYTGPESIGTVLSQSCVKKDSMTSPVMNLVPVSKSLLAKSKSQSRKDAGNASQKPMQDDMFAVKSKIQQIEMDMLKLRSKQVRQSTDGKQNVSSVFQNHFDEGIESRTVLVANVHFAATKESLISHFGKCGTISKVIMLTDAVTGLPKGAAYLVFANKESVDKAISLSGTSFFSRILKVIRKVEVPPDYLVPSHPASKQQLQQPFYPYPYGQVPTPKSHKSSHLQWRRDQHLSSENPLTTSSNRLGSSRPIE